MGIAYNSRVVVEGLVLALDAGNSKSYPGSGTTWTDLSGQGNNGTITGAVYTNGSFDFDGVKCPVCGTKNNPKKIRYD
jgi:hypothetical protein